MRLPETPLERESLRAARAREQGEDKARLKALGVVHTPLPLVHFALGRVEHALRHDLGLTHGFASQALQLLDPALGNGVWLSALLARLTGESRPRALLGFEADGPTFQAASALLAPAAHAACVELTLRHANTLSIADPWCAGDDVRVVLGNPPWGARSLSRGLSLNDAWLREFHRDHLGRPLGERRSGVLSDDYVRFFCWALEQARRAPCGAVVCFVSNASYLDGPVHRGMRAALSAAFDRIELFDLGGGSLRSRGSELDQPLFPVRVGALLSVCVRSAAAAKRARVAYQRLAGSRAQKLAHLETDSALSPSFEPAAPWFRFVPEAPVMRARVDDSFALNEAFPFHGEGVQTNRDLFATAPSERELWQRLTQIAAGELALQPSRHFDPERVRRELLVALDGERAGLVGPLSYRPFETRFFWRLAPLCHRPRPLLARAVEASELCLLSSRKEPGAAPWNMFALSSVIADSSYLSVRSACRTRVFPSHDPEGAANVSASVLDGLAARIGRAPGPRELLLYAVSVLGAARFRAEHEEQLKLDYPRIPWPGDAASFDAQVAAGELFWRALTCDRVTQPTLFLRSTRAPGERVSRHTMRWISPHQLELCSGTEIGARNERPFRAAVGHHDLIARAYRIDGSATIAEVHEACERSAMWAEAERAADAAYQPASSVRRAAKVVAGED